MLPIIYACWLGIPLGFLLFGFALRMIQLVQGSSDDVSASSRAFHAAKLAALSAVIAFAADIVIFRDEVRFEPQSNLLFLVRAGIFPLLLAAGYIISFARRGLNAGEDRFRMQVPGSGGLLFLVLGLVAVVVIWFRPKEGFDMSRVAGAGEGEPVLRFEAIESWMQSLADSIHSRENGRGSARGRQLPSPVDPSPRMLEHPDFDARGADLYAPVIREIASDNGVDPWLAQAIAEVSSGYDINFISPGKRIGLMQLPESVLRKYGANDPIQPRQNIRAAAGYLSALSRKYPGRFDTILSAYYTGDPDGALSPTLSESAGFVDDVTEVYGILRANAGGQNSSSSGSP